jgi:hypothetical protein
MSLATSSTTVSVTTVGEPWGNRCGVDLTTYSGAQSDSNTRSRQSAMGLRLTTIVLALLAGVLILNAPLNAGVLI